MLALPSVRPSARRRLFCDALKRRRRAVARNLRAFARATPASKSSQPLCAPASVPSCPHRHDLVPMPSHPSSRAPSLPHSPSTSFASTRSIPHQPPPVSSPPDAPAVASHDHRVCASTDPALACAQSSLSTHRPPSLSQFVELDQDVDQLSDMHFSDVDCHDVPAQSNSANALMVTDPFSSVWLGDEDNFTHFEDMSHLTEEQPHSANAQAVFNVSDHQHQQWTRDAELHNLQFANGFVDRGLDDIRLFAHEFQQQHQHQQQQPQPLQLPSAPRQRPR